MKNCIVIISGVVLLIMTASCRKESTPGQQKVVHDTTLIAEITRLDTTRTPGQDTVAKYSFKYDAQDRISKVILYGYGFGSVPTGSVNEYEYLYAGNDTLPKTFVHKNWIDISTYTANADPDEKDTIYLFYSGNRIIKDSVFFNNASYSGIARVTTYDEINSNQYRIHIRSVNRSGVLYMYHGTFNVTVLKQNGNIVEMRDTIPFFGNMLQRRVTLTYDNMTNPLKRVALRYPIYRNPKFSGYVPDFVVPYILGNVNSNNILSMTADESPPYFLQFKYDYKSNGLPTQVRTLAVRDYNQLYKY